MRIRIEEHSGVVAFGNARQEWKERRGLLVFLEEDGIEGVGECSPLPGHSIDTLEDCRAELERLAPRSPAARCAMETAKLDLEAKKRGTSISAILGAKRTSIELSALIGSIAEAEDAYARGIRTIKLKIGPQLDLRLLSQLRDRYGDIAIRLDANRCWDAAEANAALRALVPFHPELVEEPTSDWEHVDPIVPLALDETLFTADEAKIRSLAPKARALILKPMALGYLRALDLAKLAEELDLAVAVTHLFDGPVALNAAKELALALPGHLLPCGLDRHPALDIWPSSGREIRDTNALI